MATYKLTKKTDANGSTADMLLSAESIEKDTTVTSGSSKPVTSGAVYNVLSDYIKKGTTNTLSTTTTLNTSIANTFTICRQTANGGAFIDYAGNNQTTKYWRVGCGGGLDFEIYSGDNGTNTKVFNITSAGNVAITGSISEGGTSLSNKYQATLVSGTNIKTINNTSLLGSGNISISSVSITSATLTLVE